MNENQYLFILVIDVGQWNLDEKSHNSSFYEMHHYYWAHWHCTYIIVLHIKMCDVIEFLFNFVIFDHERLKAVDCDITNDLSMCTWSFKLFLDIQPHFSWNGSVSAFEPILITKRSLTNGFTNSASMYMFVFMVCNFGNLVKIQPDKSNSDLFSFHQQYAQTCHLWISRFGI